jgi:hypothetical protein
MGEHPNPDKTEERFTFSLDLYLNAGIRPGDFLYCVLCNDLKGAIQRADMYSQINLKHIVAYLIEYFPPNAWGSEEKVHKHIREVSKQVYGKD